jgi:hypothetical protein
MILVAKKIAKKTTKTGAAVVPLRLAAVDVAAPVNNRMHLLGGVPLRPSEAVARWEAQLAMPCSRTISASTATATCRRAGPRAARC